MALRGDLIRRVTSLLHGYNNISPAHTRYLSRYFSASGRKNIQIPSRINKHRFHRVFFDHRQQKGERSGGNWLRLWKLVNHDGALPPPPVKIGERAGKLVSREQLFLSDEGNDDGRAGKLRLRRPPPAFRGRKKARGPARERLVNSSRSAPFPYERQPFDKSATKDL